MILFSRSFIRRRAISLAITASVAATSFAVAQDPTRAQQVRAAMPVQNVAERLGNANEESFLSENDTAMRKMMADMMIKPTGDVDRDFVAMMVPHHQGAVAMAKAELEYGRNEQLRRLAQEIIANQQQEIIVMRDAVRDDQSSPDQSSRRVRPHAELPAQSAPTDGSVAQGGLKMSR